MSGSHPSRVRGLKFKMTSKQLTAYDVAPLAGAWIEIKEYVMTIEVEYVAPLAGAWIEIHNTARKEAGDSELGEGECYTEQAGKAGVTAGSNGQSAAVSLYEGTGASPAGVSEDHIKRLSA